MRLFVGMPVPAAQTLAELTGELPDGARPVVPGSWHITLRFLGEVLPRELPAIEAALAQAVAHRPALGAVVEGLGAFPDAKRARVAWAGVRAPGVEALANAVVERTRTFGEPPEARRFVAHATLARFARPVDLRALVDRHRGTLLGEGRLDRMVLWESRPGPGGPAYSPVRTWTLTGRPAEGSPSAAG